MKKTLHCPNCGEDLVKGVCGSCGYGAKKASAVNDMNRLRCEWNSDGERCRYHSGINSDPHASPEGTRGAPWFCTQHYGCADAVFGSRIVAESVAKFPVVPDYSASAVLARIRHAYARPSHEADDERAAIQAEG